jgi:regulator of protease activity HflC (stomatin/prohibitin superfamily)
MRNAVFPVGVLVLALVLVLAFGSRLYKTVPPGHVAVATIFGKVVEDPYPEGLHVPVNPLYEWYLYDARDKTHKETANVPSQDQLQTSLEVSVQYRIEAAMTPMILRDTGDAEQVKRVHLVPKLRSLLREQGKSIVRAEDFFQEQTQERLQSNLLDGMKTYLAPKGVNVEAVLIRDITLPPFITKAIEAKKEREQEVEKQKAELERFRTEQEQKVAAAEAERVAAEEQAKRQRILADAQAYEIEQINRAVAQNPAYLQLQAMDALKKIARDPAAKIYFLDGSSPSPLPLMNIGDPVTGSRP